MTERSNPSIRAIWASGICSGSVTRRVYNESNKPADPRSASGIHILVLEEVMEMKQKRRKKHRAAIVLTALGIAAFWKGLNSKPKKK